MRPTLRIPPGAVRPLRRLWQLGLVGYLGLICWLSLIPGPELPIDPGRFDKLWHAAGYAIAAFALVPLWRCWWPLLLGGLALAAMGLGIEVLQGLGGQRSFDWWDALANTLGVGVGLLAGLSPLRGALSTGKA